MRRWTVACCAALACMAAGAATTAPAPATPAPQAARAGKDDKVVLNFVDADITSVVSALARFLGRNFLFDPRVKGRHARVRRRGAGGHRLRHARHGAAHGGFAIVDVGEVSRVYAWPTPKSRAARRHANPGGGLARTTFRLNYENSDAMVAVLKPLIAARTPSPPTRPTTRWW